MPRKKLEKKDGLKLKQIRLDHELTQQEFGERLGCTQPTIQKYETGRLDIPWSVIQALNKEFKISFDWWSSNTGKKEVKKEGEGSTLIKDIATANNLIAQLTIRVQRLEDNQKKMIRDFYEDKKQQ